jgi:hypothetical protein
MAQIVFETEQAEFRFEAQAVIQHLRHLQEEHDRPDLQRRIDGLGTNKAEEIKLQAIPDWFGIIAIELLEQGRGQVFCKHCRQSYEAGNLSLFPLGAGTSPFEVASGSRVSLIDRLFQSPRRMPGMFGGKGFRCPAGHRLISQITWIS